MRAHIAFACLICCLALSPIAACALTLTLTLPIEVEKPTAISPEEPVEAILPAPASDADPPTGEQGQSPTLVPEGGALTLDAAGTPAPQAETPAPQAETPAPSPQAAQGAQPTPAPAAPCVEVSSTTLRLTLCEGGARPSEDVVFTLSLRNDAPLAVDLWVGQALDETGLDAYGALGYLPASMARLEGLRLMPGEEKDVPLTLPHDPSHLIPAAQWQAYQAEGLAPPMCFAVAWSFVPEAEGIEP